MESRRVRSCCVPKCENKIARRYHFTTNKECRTIWLRRINNPKFLDMDESRINYNVICQTHFDKECIQENGKLRKDALPTLNISGKYVLMMIQTIHNII
jgi:THAP domain